MSKIQGSAKFENVQLLGETTVDYTKSCSANFHYSGLSLRRKKLLFYQEIIETVLLW